MDKKKYKIKANCTPEDWNKHLNIKRERNKINERARTAKFSAERRLIEKEKKKKYYQENKEKILAKLLENGSNREQRLIKKKEWRLKNPHKIKEYELKRSINKKQDRNNYYKVKRREDVCFAMSRRLRCRIRTAIRNVVSGSYVKCYKSTELLGCTMDEFKFYIENKFSCGMCWSRFSEIHLDHIKPIILFDLTKESDLKECFHHTNYQPLWKEDNQKKGSVYGGKRYYTKR